MHKKVELIQRDSEAFWVGDGFPVRNFFSYTDLATRLSPFLHFDYAGPARFEPTSERRGVGPHPHRGFETVSIIYDGEVEHRDTSGGGGVIGPGEVQWMTAGAGIVHEEFHGKNYAKSGGPFEMIQLWVNLPRVHKMAPPAYQGLPRETIPTVALPKEAGSVRIIAGSYEGTPGPARTFTPMQVWDLRLKAGKDATLPCPDGHMASLFLMDGKVRFEDGETLGAPELALLTRSGADFIVHAERDCRALVLMGAPIDEPIVGHGPFVMNTEAEIHEAIRDYRSGKMGRLS
jgi:redox-sensitive bicupin YhaK (pirin superfamily)